MVEKITIFEPHFDGAQFGPASIEPEGDEREMSEPGAADESGSKPQSVMAIQGATVFVLLFVTLWVLLSRLLSDETAETD